MTNHIIENKAFLELLGERKSVRDAASEMLKLTTEAILEHTTKQACQEINSLFPDIQILIESFPIHFSDDSHQTSAYYLGAVKALADLLVHLEKDLSEVRQVNKLRNHKHLFSLMSFVEANGRVSSAKINKHFNFKHRSNLSNLMKRIDKHQLFTIYKANKTNYYSLSAKGERILHEFKRNSKSNSLVEDSESFWYSILDQLALSMQNSHAIPDYIIYNANLNSKASKINNSSLLRIKITKIIRNRNNYLREQTAEQKWIDIGYDIHNHSPIAASNLKKSTFQYFTMENLRMRSAFYED